MTGKMRGMAWPLYGAVTLIIGFLLGPLHPYGAHAIWGNCLDDPKVWLSDGMKLDLSTEIAAPPDAIMSVTYVLHVAPGVTVDHAVFTHNSRPYLENLVVLNDAALGHISTETTVLMLTPGGTSIQATAHINQGASGSASGNDGQDLVINL